LPAEALVASAFALSLVVVLAVTPLAIRIADRTGFHDQPIGYKGHAKPTPYLGGAAVFSGYLLGALLAGAAGSRLVWIPVFAIVLWAVGTLDDRRTVTPQLRVLAEAGAAAVLFAVGLGWTVTGNDVGDLAITVIWVVALSNAFNLMDNMDGAACTVAVFSSLGTAVIALVLGDETLAALSLALAGACLGFLRYNLAGPARIFLGDGGSMPIGFVVSATIMALPLDHHVGWHGLATGVLLAGLPLLDTTLVILSRRRAGVAVMQGGRDHLTHRLRSRLPSERAVAGALGAAQAALCAGALWLSQHGGSATAVASALLLLAGAAAVAVLETRTWAPVRAVAEATGEPAEADLEGGVAPSPPPPAVPEPEREPIGGPLLRTYPLEVALVLIVAASCGLSPFFYGFYDLSTWGPIALGLLAVLLGLVVARPAVPRPAALAALGALAGLAVWALVSRGWAGSPGNALTEASRWMLYATLLGILLLLLRDDRLGRLLLGATTAFVLALGLYVLGAMLTGDGGLFQGQRLFEPLGYVNGQATYFLLGLWPLVALAERLRRPLAAGAALGAATMLAGLMVLSESRAVVPAIVVSAVALLAFVPGRVRRGWALVVILGTIGAIARPLLDLYEQGGNAVSGGSARNAALAILVGAATAGLVWTIVTAVAERAAAEASDTALRRAPAVALVAVALGAVVVAGTAIHDPAHAISRQWKSFTHLAGTSDQRTRFVSGGGNRYDYWRIALDELESEPLRGVGAGSYQFAYYKERRTAEDVRQPHSIELQALSELGLVGGGLVAIFIGAVLVGLVRRASLARRSPADAGLVVAAGGIFLVWLVHTSVDWVHLIPGVTGVALAAAAVLLSPWRRTAAGRGPLHMLVVACCAALVVGAAVFLGRATLADRHATNAQDASATNPRRALAEADRSLALNHDAVSTHYLRSAAYARLGDYVRSRDSLLVATRVEPQNFVTWALLGDLSVRRGDRRLAQAYYRKALALNPRDPQLRTLARNPPPTPTR
jgi:UDP-GlcNAc:undecaprenyl-phosphate/decaprenyl-phosphate GlcNAc-1-phosphate transferase